MVEHDGFQGQTLVHDAFHVLRAFVIDREDGVVFVGGDVEEIADRHGRGEALQLDDGRHDGSDGLLGKVHGALDEKEFLVGQGALFPAHGSHGFHFFLGDDLSAAFAAQRLGDNGSDPVKDHENGLEKIPEEQKRRRDLEREGSRVVEADGLGHDFPEDQHGRRRDQRGEERGGDALGKMQREPHLVHQGRHERRSHGVEQIGAEKNAGERQAHRGYELVGGNSAAFLAEAALDV